MLFLSFSETDTADDRSESYKIINAATNSCQENGSEIRENKARRCDKRLIIIAILFLINVINSLFISLLSPFFPIVAIQKGASKAEIGIILGCYQLVMLLSTPFFGTIISKTGPKFMFVVGSFVVSICAALFGILEWCPNGPLYVAMCSLSRSIEALGAAASTIASCAIASFLFLDNLNFVMGLLQAGRALGLMIGPVCGGLLYSIDGFYLPFTITSAIYFLLAIAALIILPTIQNDQQATQSNIPLMPLFKSPTTIIIGCLLAVAQVLLGFLDVALSPYLKQFHLTPTQVGAIFLIAPAALALTSPIYGKITDKFGRDRIVLIIGVVISLLGFLLIGPSKLFFFIRCKLWIIGVSFGIAGIGWGSIITTYKEFVNVAKSKDYPEGIETDGVISGLYNAYNNFGAFLGPIASGYMVDKLGFQWSSTVLGGIFAFNILCLIGLTVNENCQRKIRDPETEPIFVRHLKI